MGGKYTKISEPEREEYNHSLPMYRRCLHEVIPAGSAAFEAQGEVKHHRAAIAAANVHACYSPRVNRQDDITELVHGIIGGDRNYFALLCQMMDTIFVAALKVKQFQGTGIGRRKRYKEGIRFQEGCQSQGNTMVLTRWYPNPTRGTNTPSWFQSCGHAVPAKTT